MTRIRMDYADYRVDVDLGDLAHPVRVGAAGMLFPRCTALPIEKVPPAALRRAAAIAKGAHCHDACSDLLRMCNRPIA